ncbi:MAG: hypothetical protein R3E08_07965 [Thiotrichaceae bacterium]
MGQSFIDCVPYINSTCSGELMYQWHGPDETPEIHDWYNILSEFNWLALDHFLTWRMALAFLLIILALI